MVFIFWRQVLNVWGYYWMTNKQRKAVISKIKQHQKELTNLRRTYVQTSPLDDWNAKAQMVFANKHLDAAIYNLERNL